MQRFYSQAASVFVCVCGSDANQGPVSLFCLVSMLAAFRWPYRETPESARSRPPTATKVSIGGGGLIGGVATYESQPNGQRLKPLQREGHE